MSEYFRRIGILCALFVFAFSARPMPAQTPVGRSSQQWKIHEAAALDDLTQASECLSKSLAAPKPNQSCDPTEALAKATAEYGQLQSLISDGSAGAEEAATVADGLTRSGATVAAIKFLVGRTDTATNPTLSHLLGDSLFAIGDYRNAALAYRNWIGMGCAGYFNSMHDRGFWVTMNKLDKCSQLPVTLRSRLEMLQGYAHGEPANLPAHNFPPGQDTAQ
jgi:hypothetical protein